MLLLLPPATTLVLLLAWTSSHAMVLHGVRGGRVRLGVHLSSPRTRGIKEHQHGRFSELKVDTLPSYSSTEREDLEIEVRLAY